MVELVTMSPEDFNAYLDAAVENYAQEHMKAGTMEAATAMEDSRKEFAALLPDGVNSKDQYLYSILDADAGTKVGMLWFANQSKGSSRVAFIYDFTIYDEFQRKGYASQAMYALEDKVKELNLSEIELHVFGHNTAARALYEKVGYEVTNLRMVKQLH